MEQEKFETWGIVEIFGRDVYAGKISSQLIGTCSFVRVDVPAVGDRPQFTKLFGEKSIFSMTPTSEEVCMAVLKNRSTPPLNIFDMDAVKTAQLEDHRGEIENSNPEDDFLSTHSDNGDSDEYFPHL